MNILAVGDIVGNAGIQKLQNEIKNIIQDYNVDFVIANGENAAEGMGITEKNFNDIISCGVDCITMGNHTWGKKDIFKFINHPKLIRPNNYPEGVVGKGYNIYNCKNKKIAVINSMGRAEINIGLENPFLLTKKMIDILKDKVDIIVVDFHAEATAEKVAMGHFLDGEATIVFGTHTHIQTADEKILENGTAYITDIGMTGPSCSAIGMDIDVAIKRFTTSIPERYKIASGKCQLDSVLFEIDDNTNKVVNLKRINL